MAEEFLPLTKTEQDNDTSWYTSVAAGIASGIIKIPEGVFSLAAELIDLGADTNLAGDVDRFFDKLNPFEEVAEENGIGRLTEALIQVGVPGAIGFKAANKLARNITARALKAKRANAFASFKNTKDRAKLSTALDKVKELNTKARAPRFAVGLMGGAAGEVFVADVEKIGTFGDMFEGGPTQLDRDEVYGREEAARRLVNRLKFGSESIAFTPFVYGVGKSAKLLASRGKDLAYSNSRFARWLDKYVRAPFSPRGGLTQELFDEEKIKEALKASDQGRAKEIVDNITKEVDRLYPDAENIIGKAGKAERTKFFTSLNEVLFGGNIKKPLNKNALDDLLKQFDDLNVSAEAKGNIVGSLNNAREEFVKLIDILDANAQGTKLNKGVSDLQTLLKDRVTNWIGGTYRIFEEPKRGFLTLFNRYTPTDEAKEGAIRFFREQIAKEAGDTGFNVATSDKYFREAKVQVESLLNAVRNKGKPKALALGEYINKTMEGRPGADFVKQVIDGTGLPPKEIRQLLGEITDPRYSIYNAITNLSGVARTTAYLSSVVAKNDQIQKAGGRGFFWNSVEEGEQALRSNTTGIRMVPVDDIVKELPGSGKFVNPAAGKFTTVEIAEALKNANNIAGGLQGFVRGEGKEGAEAAVSWMYRNLLLFPKGISQLAKTVFSIPTHLRNMFSAFGFAGANGTLFDTEFYKSAFAEGIEVSGLLKAGAPSAKAQAAYRELLELGVVNSQVQIADLKALLTDVRLGQQVANIDTTISPFMNKMRKVRDFFQGKYVAEDDTFKIANYVVELKRLKNYRANGRPVNRNVIKLPESELNIKYNVARKNGFKGTYDEFLDDFALKTEAADIVKNTVPNYAFVGSAVRTARLLPIGNFMSFPSEMIRTTTNIVEQGLKELRHVPAPGVRVKGSNIGLFVTEVLEDGTERVVSNNARNLGTYKTGLTRLLGMATFTTGIPIALTEGAAALYDVTKDELDALRRFVPEWSKNSTLIPIRDDDGELRYIDFSHSNAYDIISRPLRTVVNNIQQGDLTDEQLLTGFVNGITEASAEIMNPFISESIWTEATADLIVRGGRTADGRRLYTEQTSAGDKAAIRFLHLGNALAPSYKQYVRLLQAATETPTKRGEELDVGPEIAGFMGLRPIKVDPLRSMGFKIANYQRGIRNARREFTGGYFGLLKGGPVEVNDIITRFAKSNNARFDVMQEMKKDINAAETLGVGTNELLTQFKDRQISDKNFTNLRIGRFEPYFPSEDIEERFREIARNLGTGNPYIAARPILRRMAVDMKQVSLDSPLLFTSEIPSFEEGGLVETGEPLNIENYLIPEIPTPPIPANIAGANPNPQVIQTAQQPTVTQQGLTETEKIYLSPEEQQIVLRQRGMIT
jgi:hypothetical protein